MIMEEKKKPLLSWNPGTPKPLDKLDTGDKKPEKEKEITNPEPEKEDPGKKRSETGKKKRATFFLHKSALLTLHRAAYWERKDQWKIIEEALEKFYAGKVYDPAPDEPDDLKQ